MAPWLRNPRDPAMDPWLDPWLGGIEKSEIPSGNHRKTIGKCWFHGDLMGFYGMYPLVICYIAIEHHHVHWETPLYINGDVP